MILLYNHPAKGGCYWTHKQKYMQFSASQFIVLHDWRKIFKEIFPNYQFHLKTQLFPGLQGIRSSWPASRGRMIVARCIENRVGAECRSQMTTRLLCWNCGMPMLRVMFERVDRFKGDIVLRQTESKRSKIPSTLRRQHSVCAGSLRRAENLLTTRCTAACP